MPFFQYFNDELAWWINVGVQIFFVISVFLDGSKDMDDPVDFIKKQFQKILIPYYTFLIPVSVIYILFARDSFSVISWVKAIFCVGTIDGIEHLWFVGYILVCYLITPYLYWLREKTKACSELKTSILYLSLVAVGIAALCCSTHIFLPVVFFAI